MTIELTACGFYDTLDVNPLAGGDTSRTSTWMPHPNKT